MRLTGDQVVSGNRLALGVTVVARNWKSLLENRRQCRSCARVAVVKTFLSFARMDNRSCYNNNPICRDFNSL